MYTPQFSDLASISVRRLAWAMGGTMGAAVERMVQLLPAVFDASKVCLSCKDTTKCQGCIFRQNITDKEKAVLVSLD